MKLYLFGRKYIPEKHISVQKDIPSNSVLNKTSVFFFHRKESCFNLECVDCFTGTHLAILTLLHSIMNVCSVKCCDNLSMNSFRR